MCKGPVVVVGVVNSGPEWWCFRLGGGVMGKEEGGKAGGGELDWALLDQVGHGEQLCPPPESTGGLPELRRPEWITVVNRSLQSLVRRGRWTGG